MAGQTISTAIGKLYLTSTSNPLTITSTGSVTTTASGDAIDAPSGTAWQINNAGTISGVIGTSSAGIYSPASGIAVQNTGRISAPCRRPISFQRRHRHQWRKRPDLCDRQLWRLYRRRGRSRHQSGHDHRLQLRCRSDIQQRRQSGRGRAALPCSTGWCRAATGHWNSPAALVAAHYRVEDGLLQ